MLVDKEQGKWHFLLRGHVTGALSYTAKTGDSKEAWRLTRHAFVVAGSHQCLLAQAMRI